MQQSHETAVELSTQMPLESNGDSKYTYGRVYVANGDSFPDATSASAAASIVKGRVLLVTRDQVPDAVLQEMQRLESAYGCVIFKVVGGTGAVSVEVERTIRKIGGQFSVSRLAGRDC